MFNEYLFIDSGEMMQRVLYEDFFLFYGGWHVRYEEMWKVFNISMSSLVSVCTAILGSVAFFHQSSSFSHFFMNINFNRKCWNVHTEIGLSWDCNCYNLEAWSMISSKLFSLRKFSFRLCQTRVVYEKR